MLYNTFQLTHIRLGSDTRNDTIRYDTIWNGTMKLWCPTQISMINNSVYTHIKIGHTSVHGEYWKEMKLVVVMLIDCGNRPVKNMKASISGHVKKRDGDWRNQDRDATIQSPTLKIISSIINMETEAWMDLRLMRQEPKQKSLGLSVRSQEMFLYDACNSSFKSFKQCEKSKEKKENRARKLINLNKINVDNTVQEKWEGQRVVWVQ